jgi:hypothetical protein
MKVFKELVVHKKVRQLIINMWYCRTIQRCRQTTILNKTQIINKNIDIQLNAHDALINNRRNKIINDKSRNY